MKALTQIYGEDGDKSIGTGALGKVTVPLSGFLSSILLQMQNHYMLSLSTSLHFAQW